MLTRRDLIKAGFAIPILAYTFGSSRLIAQKKMGSARSCGFYVMQFGTFKLVALEDGLQMLPFDKLLTRTTPEHVRSRLKRDLLTSPVPVSTNAFLLDGGGRRVLIDTGAGSLLDREVGLLPHGLNAAGYKPEDITDIVLTHLHVDHGGGLVRAGKIAFPNATLHVARKEADHWLDPAKRAAAKQNQQETFAAAPKILTPYRDAGRLRLTADGDTIIPGITLISRPGHTPGTLEIKVESNGHTILFLGDMLHSEQVQFAEPDIAFTFDENESSAIANRRTVLAEAAEKQYWLAFAHVSFPGIGHVRRAAKGYDWIPVAYGVDA
jgi:glyoxylase-like metal-dependent hydrolase (beta-lactamase superfamily II)